MVLRLNLHDVQAHWVALHEALSLGAPFVEDAQYRQALTYVDAVFDQVAADAAHPLGGLLTLLADRIHEYEDRVHPWPDTSTPATVLTSLMQDHGLTQSELPEVGAQSVVSAVLAGKRRLNLRQVKALASRFSVPLEMFV